MKEIKKLLGDYKPSPETQAALDRFNALTPAQGGWCRCEQSEFASYPQDGECRQCSMHKHHVHCRCGGIMQIG